MAGRAEAAIVAGSPPVHYLAERLAGGDFAVGLLLPQGENPEHWLPADADIARLQGARLIILNGAELAGWREVAVLPERRVLETADAFRDEWIEVEGATHSHGPEGEHSHAGVAPFTWLDPLLAIEQAAAIRDRLAALRGGDAAQLAERFEALRAELRGLHQRLEAAAGIGSGRPLIASHPLYPYPARRYKLNLVDLVWEPDEAPPAEAWEALDALLREHPARWMIWEAEPLPEVRAGLAARGLGIVIVDPLAEGAASGDFLDGMRANTDSLERALTTLPEALPSGQQPDE